MVSMTGGIDGTEAMREAEARWKLRQRQAEDWMKTAKRQFTSAASRRVSSAIPCSTG